MRDNLRCGRTAWQNSKCLQWLASMHSVLIVSLHLTINIIIIQKNQKRLFYSSTWNIAHFLFFFKSENFHKLEIGFYNLFTICQRRYKYFSQIAIIRLKKRKLNNKKRHLFLFVLLLLWQSYDLKTWNY